MTSWRQSGLGIPIFHIPFFHFLHEFREIREIFLIQCEVLEILHIVDIHVEHINGNVIGSVETGTVSMFQVREALTGLQNHQDYYKAFYHQIDGRMVRHDKVHNLFGCRTPTIWRKSSTPSN